MRIQQPVLLLSDAWFAHCVSLWAVIICWLSVILYLYTSLGQPAWDRPLRFSVDQSRTVCHDSEFKNLFVPYCMPIQSQEVCSSTLRMVCLPCFVIQQLVTLMVPIRRWSAQCFHALQPDLFDNHPRLSDARVYPQSLSVEHFDTVLAHFVIFDEVSSLSRLPSWTCPLASANL